MKVRMIKKSYPYHTHSISTSIKFCFNVYREDLNLDIMVTIHLSIQSLSHNESQLNISKYINLNQSQQHNWIGERSNESELMNVIFPVVGEKCELPLQRVNNLWSSPQRNAHIGHTHRYTSAHLSIPEIPELNVICNFYFGYFISYSITSFPFNSVSSWGNWNYIKITFFHLEKIRLEDIFRYTNSYSTYMRKNTQLTANENERKNANMYNTKYIILY